MNAEDLSGAAIMDLIDRLADSNRPYVTIEGTSAVFEFPSSSSLASPTAQELQQRPGVSIGQNIDRHLHFTHIKIHVALDCLRPGDVEDIRRAIAARAAQEAEVRAQVAAMPLRQPEILMPPDGC